MYSMFVVDGVSLYSASEEYVGDVAVVLMMVILFGDRCLHVDVSIIIRELLIFTM